jgi:hypothetical protein
MVFWSWTMSGEGLNSTRPPSPRKTLRPHFRVAGIAVARAMSLAPAVVADSAAGDVIDDHTITLAETTAAWSDPDDLTARFVPGNHALIALRPFAQMLVVNTSNIRAAYSGGFHEEKDFSMPWLRIGDLAAIHRAVAWQIGAGHCAIAPSGSQRSSQV